METSTLTNRKPETYSLKTIECGFVASTTKKANLISMIALLQGVLVVFMLSVTFIKATYASRIKASEQPAIASVYPDHHQIQQQPLRLVEIETSNLKNTFAADASVPAQQYQQAETTTPSDSSRNNNRF